MKIEDIFDERRWLCSVILWFWICGRPNGWTGGCESKPWRNRKVVKEPAPLLIFAIKGDVDESYTVLQKVRVYCT